MLWPRPVEAEHIFLPAFHPLDGAAQLHRQEGNGDFLGEEAALLSEAAAHVGAGNTHRFQGTLQQTGQVLPYFVGVLRRVPYRQQVGLGVVLGQQAAGFHGRRGQALHVELLADDAVSGGEGFVQVSPGVDRAKDNIASQVVVYDGGVLRRCLPAGL